MTALLTVTGHQYDPIVGTVVLIALLGGAGYAVYRRLTSPEAEVSPYEEQPEPKPGTDYEGAQDQQPHWESGRQQRRSSTHEDTREQQQSRREPVDADRYFGEVLGLKGQVTKLDIARRYKELAAQYHPDKVNHLGPKLRAVAESEMKAINEAYDFFRHKYNI
jgi:hypothetical protein